MLRKWEQGARSGSNSHLLRVHLVGVGSTQAQSSFSPHWVSIFCLSRAWIRHGRSVADRASFSHRPSLPLSSSLSLCVSVQPHSSSLHTQFPFLTSCLADLYSHWLQYQTESQQSCVDFSIGFHRKQGLILVINLLHSIICSNSTPLIAPRLICSHFLHTSARFSGIERRLQERGNVPRQRCCFSVPLSWRPPKCELFYGLQMQGE